VRDTSRGCRTGGDIKEGLVCACAEKTVTLVEKRALALDWLVERLLSLLKKKQVPLEEKKRLLSAESVHAHANRAM